jgi:predicted Zn finger-like uncharacterized protein
MSLITRCPACGTMFKVVPDQLKISEGWVRCGHCADVFDATAHLQQEAPATEPDSLIPVPQLLRHAEPAPARRAADEGFASSLNTEVGDGLSTDPPDSSQLEEEALALMEQPQDEPFELRRQDAPLVEEPRSRAATQPAPIEAEPELHDLSFVRKARRLAFWRSPLVRVALFFLLLLLGSLLVLQVAVHDRNRLAAADPALRPWLARLCDVIHCTIDAPRQIESIAIDSSSFNKLRGDAFRLNVALKNQASTEVAMPALELTLTDAQDQALLRRVIMPAEFAPNRRAIAAGGEWTGSLALGVAANGATSRVAGYRLLAFYP